MSAWVQRKLSTLEKDIMVVMSSHIEESKAVMPLLNHMIEARLRNFPDLVDSYRFGTEADKVQELDDVYMKMFSDS